MPDEFLDRNGELLSEGFYWDETRASALYFTGKCDKNNFALFESTDGNIIININHANESLCRVRDPRGYAELKQKEADWDWKKN